MYASTKQKCEVFVKVAFKKLLQPIRDLFSTFISAIVFVLSLSRNSDRYAPKSTLFIVFDKFKNQYGTFLLTEYYTT